MKPFLTTLALSIALPLFAAAPDERGFIRDWLLAGAYPSYEENGRYTGLTADHLEKAGGEANFEPEEGITDTALFRADQSKLIAGIGSTNEWGFTEDRSFAVKWQKVHIDTAKPDLILDKRFLPFDDHFVAYAACYIEAPEKRLIKLRTGSDDDHRIYLNGRLVGEHSGSQGINPDNFIYNAELKQGLNVLLYKIVDRTHGCGFCLAISDRDDRPMTDLVIRLDNPRREAMRRYRLEKPPQAYDRGRFAEFQLPPLVLRGKVNITIRTGGPSGSYPSRLTLQKENGPAVEFQRELRFEPERLAVWSETPELAAGKYTAILFTGKDARLEYSFEVQDPEAIAAANRTLKTRKAELERRNREAAAEKEKLSLSVARLKEAHERLYGELEAAYAALRAADAAKAGAAAHSIDQPVIPAPAAERTLLSLNGDQWFIAPPDGENWSRVKLPRDQIYPYFRQNRFPVEPVVAKDRYGKVRSLPNWQSYTFDNTLAWKQFRLRTTLRPAPGTEKYDYTLVSENINGAVKVYLNKIHCGDYAGSIGIVRIPLRGMKAGANELEIVYDDPEQSLGITGQRHLVGHTHGLRGDLMLEAAPSPIRVEEVAIRTSWRKNRLAVTALVVNRSEAAADVRLEAYAVRHGRIRYRLPPATLRVPAMGTASLDLQGKWSDPELWGIGGKYGDPALYELVTDLYLGDRLADRRVERFGFREFWIGGSDFYLNGRHIVLQGEVGITQLDLAKHNEVFFPLLRSDGINAIRNHDGEFYSPGFLRDCDRFGMLAYANMYPCLHPKGTGKPANYLPYDDFLKHELHQVNLRNYRNWFKMIRNHPSAVILSTDNELVTQAWDKPAQEAFNHRNDRLGALYNQYVKSFDPERVMTRNGDVGTWNRAGKWVDDPPCDTANYHYADFNIREEVLNWQTRFGFRPVIFGETLYYSYGAWDQWIGPIPTQVTKKAAKVRQVAAIYRDLKIPAQMYMGLAHDGFVQWDDSGEGNAFGIKAKDHDSGNVPGFPGYPWARIGWPAASGPGSQLEFRSIRAKSSGREAVNWFDPAYPAHVRNAVNAAYRETLLPMPPLAPPANAEILLELGKERAGEVVRARAADSPLQSLAVTADQTGTAWLTLPHPGEYDITLKSETRRIRIPERSSYAAAPGFDRIPRLKW